MYKRSTKLLFKTTNAQSYTPAPVLVRATHRTSYKVGAGEKEITVEGSTQEDEEAGVSRHQQASAGIRHLGHAASTLTRPLLP